MPFRLPTVPAACLGLALQAGAARGGTFQVSPVQVHLTARQTSGLVTIRNQSETGIRLQVSTFAWQQGAKGEMLLEPTADVIVFPSMLMLAPGETRNIRVGTTASFGAVEKTYRIFVEELPPIQRTAGALKTGVQVLTRMNVPVFLEPARPVVDARVESAAVRGGHVQLEVRNTGNAHFVLQTVHAVGRDPRGRTVFDVSAPGWYVLAGGVRDYDLALRSPGCADARLLEVEMTADQASATATATVAPGDCAAP